MRLRARTSDGICCCAARTRSSNELYLRSLLLNRHATHAGDIALWIKLAPPFRHFGVVIQTTAERVRSSAIAYAKEASPAAW
jgi:hypothetical protein